MSKKIRILSLDGGGIRGIMTCVILQYIEKEIQKIEGPQAKLGDYFDLIAGTSTGGLIAAILLFPDENKKAKYTVEEALNLYANRGEDIFNVKLWKHVFNGFGWLDEKISKFNLERNLQDIFGELTLNDCIKPSLITSYDVYSRSAKFFTSHNANNELDNFYMRDVCRATSAAPTYFEPAKVYSLYKQEFTLIDGGVFANNPSLCAFVESRKIPFGTILNDPEKPNYPQLENILFVSVGTGEVKKPYTFEQLRKGGKLKWIEPLIDILLSSNSETVGYQMDKLYQSLGTEHYNQYYRLMPEIGKADPEMDKADEQNIFELIQSGKTFVNRNQHILADIARKLVDNK